MLGFDNNVALSGRDHRLVGFGERLAGEQFLGAASSAAAAAAPWRVLPRQQQHGVRRNSFTGTNDFTAGRIKVPTRAADNGTDAASTASPTAAAYVVRSYLAGLALSTAGGSSSSASQRAPR